MLYQNVELHNIDGIVDEADRGAVRLQRVPEELRLKLNPGAQQRCTWIYSSEIRLAFEGDEASVTVSSDTSMDAVVYEGPFRSQQLTIGPEPQKIVLRRAERVARLSDESRKRLIFSPEIFRLQFGGMDRGCIYLHDIEGDVRPPVKDEVPALRYLAYGTSITQSAQANHASLGYVAQAAWRLGADLINLGMGGSCHCEPEFADYMAGRDDWDFATLALSVNMVGGFTPDEFYARVEYLINKIAGSNPDRPVVCITLYPYEKDLCTNVEDQDLAELFRQKLRDAVSASEHGNLHLIEGTDILTDIGGLTTDLVHPADNGMINMGENLAVRLKDVLGAAGLTVG
jgi:lysophospholipase L1-like esterase